MEDTGRIRQGLDPILRRILFQENLNASIDQELPYMVQVDQAHLLSLVCAGIVDRNRAKMILMKIEELLETNFAVLRNRSAPRGIYLMYEDFLIEALGLDVGGVIQTGRSRNDLMATIFRLKLRQPYIRLALESLHLLSTLIRLSRRYSNIVMPLYTHFQAAVPGTFGHYLIGVATALERDIDWLFTSVEDINRCPLGAGPVGGTTLALDHEFIAPLLGFSSVSSNSLDSVASRDLVLRLLSAMSVLGTTIGRLAADLLLWSTSEFGFLSLPDRLVGSSSAMPQKRNPFLLEHVEGKIAAPVGALMAALTSMHATPFTNSVAVGTEAVSPLWSAIKNMTEAVLITRMVLIGCELNKAAMKNNASRGYTNALELANRLVTHSGVPFRLAHKLTGEIVLEAIKQGGKLLEDVAKRRLAEENIAVNLSKLDPSSVVFKSEGGGGPGMTSINKCIETIKSSRSKHLEKLSLQLRLWKNSQRKLENELSRINHR